MKYKDFELVHGIECLLSCNLDQNHLLVFSFPIDKIGITIDPTSQTIVCVKLVNPCKVLSIVPVK